MVVDGKPHVRPCVSIPPDGNEGNWIPSISDLYAPLTTPLPLAGSSALKRARGSAEPGIAAACAQRLPGWEP